VGPVGPALHNDVDDKIGLRTPFKKSSIGSSPSAFDDGDPPDLDAIIRLLLGSLFIGSSFDAADLILSFKRLLGDDGTLFNVFGDGDRLSDVLLLLDDGISFLLVD
jgi:hypothetical protein